MDARKFQELNAKEGDTVLCVWAWCDQFVAGREYVVERGPKGPAIRDSDGSLIWDTRSTFVRVPSITPTTCPSPSDDTPIKSDGGSTDYYKLPKGASELGDLIEAKDMNFNVGNIFKAAYRLGNKAGNDRSYDLNKIIWFAQRELAREQRKSQ